MDVKTITVIGAGTMGQGAVQTWVENPAADVVIS